MGREICLCQYECEFAYNKFLMNCAFVLCMCIVFENVHHKFCTWTSVPWQCVQFLPIYMLIFTWIILITFKLIFIAALHDQLNQLNRSILIKCLEIISFSFPLFADWNWLHFWFTLSLSLFSHHGLFKLFISSIWVVGIVHWDTRIYW